MATTVSLSDTLEDALLDHVLSGTVYTPPATVYAALFTASPGDDDTGTEATGGSYARQAAGFAAAASRAAATSGAITFPALAAATYTHLGLYDASTGGTLLAWGELDSPVVQSSGDDLEIPAGDLTVTFLAGAVTNYLAAELLDHVLRSESYTPPTTVELALYDETDTEWSGGSYARQTVAFGAASGGSASNSAAVDFTNAPGSTLEYGVLHEDAGAGGNGLWRTTPGAPVSVGAGSDVSVAIGDVVCTLD